MNDWILVAVAAAVVVVLFAVMLIALARSRERRSAHLREQFGSEYDRAVGRADRRSEAEQELLERERRRQELDIKPLSPAARERFIAEWESAQRRFVDDPENAVLDADRILRRVLEQRGYPVDDAEQIAADVSVDHPDVVQRYRHGHDMLGGRDRARAEGTENLRKAMIDFRAVFEEVVDAGTPATVA